MVHACNPSAGGGGGQRPVADPGPHSQLAQLSMWAPVSSEVFVYQKSKVDDAWGGIFKADLWPPHAHACMYTCMHLPWLARVACSPWDLLNWVFLSMLTGFLLLPFLFMIVSLLSRIFSHLCPGCRQGQCQWDVPPQCSVSVCAGVYLSSFLTVIIASVLVLNSLDKVPSTFPTCGHYENLAV